jgi:hypothetical protein
MRYLTLRLAFVGMFLIAASGSRLQAQVVYDLVITGGRVMDPETGRDEIANVGIRDGRIAAISSDALSGQETIDARGQIVAPGFIDILSSISRNQDAHRFKIGDGVTTTFGMHGGPLDVLGYQADHAAVGPLTNFAATVSHSGLREAVGATRGAGDPRRRGRHRLRHQLHPGRIV